MKELDKFVGLMTSAGLLFRKMFAGASASVKAMRLRFLPRRTGEAWSSKNTVLTRRLRMH